MKEFAPSKLYQPPLILWNKGLQGRQLLRPPVNFSAHQQFANIVRLITPAFLHTKPFWKGVFSKKKEFASQEQILFF